MMPDDEFESTVAVELGAGNSGLYSLGIMVQATWAGEAGDSVPLGPVRMRLAGNLPVCRVMVSK
jgi:hypothetical protein